MSFAVVRAKPIAARTAILIDALSLNALSEKIVVLIELRKTIAKQEKTMMVELIFFVNMLETSDDSTERYEIFMSLK